LLLSTATLYCYSLLLPSTATNANATATYWSIHVKTAGYYIDQLLTFIHAVAQYKDQTM